MNHRLIIKKEELKNAYENTLLFYKKVNDWAGEEYKKGHQVKILNFSYSSDDASGQLYYDIEYRIMENK